MEAKLRDNKLVARRIFEALEKDNLNEIDKVVNTTQFKLHLPGNSRVLNFDDSVKWNQDYRDAFPDMKINVEHQIAEGNFVLSRITYTGTHKGLFRGKAATGKKTKVSGMVLHQIVDSKAVEEWDEFDSLGMMQQLGVVPELEIENLNK